MAINVITQYDDANFKILREASYASVQGPASATAFAHFKSRNKAIITAVHVRLASAASAAAGSIHVCRLRNAPSNTSVQTLATNTMVSATSAGTVWSYTLTTNNTTSSLHDNICLVATGACDKGKFHVVYEYVLVPSLTKTMA